MTIKWLEQLERVESKVDELDVKEVALKRNRIECESEVEETSRREVEEE